MVRNLESDQVKRTTVEHWWVVLGLIVATAGLRLYFQEIPNFAPVAAVALFAGYLLPSRRWAVAVPIGAMLVSDWFIGGYQPLLMLTVYALLAVPVLMRGWLRERFQVGGSAASAFRSFAGLLACSLAASILFFVCTNLVVWVVTPWYPRSLAGLAECYVNALAFFRYTLAGDAAYATLLFGTHAAWQTVARPSLSSENARTLIPR
jgi:hypothetical protein